MYLQRACFHLLWKKYLEHHLFTVLLLCYNTVRRCSLSEIVCHKATEQTYETTIAIHVQVLLVYFYNHVQLRTTSPSPDVKQLCAIRVGTCNNVLNV